MGTLKIKAHFPHDVCPECGTAGASPQELETMQKWTNNGAGPIQAKRFNDAWSKINWENNTFIELTGIVGQAERRSVLSVLCGNDTRADVEAAKESIGERFNWTITRENVGDLVNALTEALTILQQNRPIHDNRTTPNEETERREKSAKIAAEQKAKSDRATTAFIAHYGSGEKITIQPGQMVIIAQICFDNSDSMTDYFDRHASLSQPFALLIVSKQAETERLARRGIETSPLLSAIPFDWHTEKWSMGHGNYLKSKDGFELPAKLQGLCNQYGSGGGVAHAHWEITFTRAYSQPITLDTIAGCGQTPPDRGEPTQTTEPVEGVTVTENNEKDGIEIRFPSKPTTAMLDSLKAAGWRWSRFSSCWYARRSDKVRQFAESLSHTKSPTQPNTQEAGNTPAPSPTSSLAARFRIWADALRPKIDHAGREMTQNPTPKRNRDYQSRMHDCRNFERLQKALRTLADAHEARTIPPELAGLRTRDEIGGMVHKYIDGSKSGYYSVIEYADFHDKSPAARLLQGMIEGTTAQQAERERLRRIEALKAEIALSTIPGYFPTPAPVVSVMLDRAQLEPGNRVLEPSAGNGSIAEAILNTQVPGLLLEVCEINPKLREILDQKLFNVVADDFMDDDALKNRSYDRVLMNPPFEKQADIDHVRKAHRLLKPGGLLVSVMAPGFEFRQDRKSSEFRTWLNEMGGTWEDLPAESFKASGTGVGTKLVTIPATTGCTRTPSTSDEESMALAYA
jgi:phospholipid N-methyltransferase